ncbi:acyloxyacyl hydrolase [Fodinibius salsisoli]|uniref:Acyloxyacyl hydrolase n=1 Tax=Fodinibius salsisoli TaxID=2820877 RepID=A0ABT3PQP6_9BACT|nr:acyloxyacyl hydrolase [Fodinibius salsisoli]MCW9708187.1 acyloxyacyl hydrolase [Fodinibius salsisoli]
MYKRSYRILLVLGVLLLSGQPSVYAVQPPDSTVHSTPAHHGQLMSPPHEFTIWAGFAFDSYSFWGKTPDTRIQSIGFGYNRKLLPIKQAVLEYHLRLDLYSSYSYPSFNTTKSKKRSSLSGLGISPLGFQLNFLSTKTVQPFLSTSTGLIFLDNPFPDFRGKKINFTLSAGAGLEIQLSPSASLSFGIKYHHLSNGERGEVNPGIDSNIYYTSITIF